MIALAFHSALIGPDSVILAVFALLLLSSVFWVWMLVDCLTNARLDSSEKLLWVVVILFAHFIGGILYFAVGRGDRTAPPTFPPR